MLLRFKHIMLEAAGGSCNNKSRRCSATFGHVQPLWLLGSSMSKSAVYVPGWCKLGLGPGLTWKDLYEGGALSACCCGCRRCALSSHQQCSRTHGNTNPYAEEFGGLSGLCQLPSPTQYLAIVKAD